MNKLTPAEAHVVLVALEMVDSPADPVARRVLQRAMKKLRRMSHGPLAEKDES